MVETLSTEMIDNIINSKLTSDMDEIKELVKFLKKIGIYEYIESIIEYHNNNDDDKFPDLSSGVIKSIGDFVYNISLQDPLLELNNINNKLLISPTLCLFIAYDILKDKDSKRIIDETIDGLGIYSPEILGLFLSTVFENIEKKKYADVSFLLTKRMAIILRYFEKKQENKGDKNDNKYN